MEESKETKIRKLAQQLKDLHMAGSVEEATARAKEIIESSGSKDNKSIGELMEEEVKEPGKDEKTLKKIKKELKEVKKKAVEEAQEHVLEKEHFKKVKKKSDDLKEDVEDIEDITEMAEEVQEKK